MGNLVAVGNLKGGTGKSTIAVNLSCALAEVGRKVVLVDADGQGTATDWHAGNRLPVQVESWPLGGERDTQRWVARVLALKAGAEDIIVDLPPQVGSGIASALLIADLFVIPVTPSGVDMRATGKALELLRRSRAVRGGDKPACLLVPSRVDRRTAVGRSIQATLERFGLKVGPAIRQRSVHLQAFDSGTWVGAHAPGSSAHAEIKVLRDRVLGILKEIARIQAQESDSLAVAPLPAAIRLAPAVAVADARELSKAAGA